MKRKTKLTKRPKREKKRIRIKIEIKKLKQIFYWRVKLRRKINLTKEPKKKTIKRIRTTLKKIIYHKLRLKDVIEKKIKVLQKSQEQKSKE